MRLRLAHKLGQTLRRRRFPRKRGVRRKGRVL